MKRKYQRAIPWVFSILLVLSIFVPHNILSEGYEKAYQDGQGDVLDSQTQNFRTSGYEHIDMINIDSALFDPILGDQLMFTMTVVGVITNSDEISYSFQILDGDEVIYYISYNNGISTGVNMKDGSTDVLKSKGAGTDTLEVTMQLSYIGEVQNFDFGGISLEYIESEGRFFLDSAGNIESIGNMGYSLYEELKVTIKEPRSGATTLGTITIVGVTDIDYKMETVEIQMDSKTNDNWDLATTSDNWGNWTYDLDTNSLSKGKHIIHARAYNGSDYFFDEIEIYVDQDNAKSPRTAQIPRLYVGDRFNYETNVHIPSLEGTSDYESTGYMNFTVEALETIWIDGTSHDSYLIKVQGYQIAYSMGFTTTVSQVGYDWIRISDHANVRSEVFTSTTTEDDEGTFTSAYNITIIYDPPLKKYDFPLSIGGKWSERCSIEYEYEDGGETFSETFPGPYDFEALHVETISTSAGSFETFVIWGEDYFYTGDGVNCNLDYYSPKLGFPVRSESYDSQRNLFSTMELVDYDKSVEEEGGESFGILGIQGSNLPIFLLIMVIIGLIIAFALIKKRRSSAAEYTQSDMGTVTGPSADLQQESSPRPGVRPLGQLSPQTQGSSPKESLPSILYTKCPKCSQLISYNGGVSAVQCPFCKTVIKVLKGL